jgi:hypothetical protein
VLNGIPEAAYPKDLYFLRIKGTCMSVKKLLVVSSLLCATFGHASQTTTFSREEISGLFNTPSMEVASLSDEQLKGTEAGNWWNVFAGFLGIAAAPLQGVGAVQMPDLRTTLRMTATPVIAGVTSGSVVGIASQFTSVVTPMGAIVTGAATCGGTLAVTCVNWALTPAAATPVTVITPPITGAVTGSGSSSSSAVATVIGAPTQQSMSPPPRRLAWSAPKPDLRQRFRGR